MSHLSSEQLAAQKAAARDKKRFVKLSYNGSYCIFPPDEIPEWPEDDDAVPTMEDIWLTQDEYDALPEFGGW